MSDHEEYSQHTHMVRQAACIHWARIKGKTWLTLDDLEQAGHIGLIEGLHRYDEDKSSGHPNAKLAYLWSTIYGNVQKEITQHNHTLRVGHKFKRKASKINRDPDKSDEDWAKELGIRVSEVRIMRKYLSAVYCSFDYEDENTIYTMAETVAGPDQTYDYDLADTWERLERACRSDLDRVLIRLRAMGYAPSEIVEMVQHERLSSCNAPHKKISESIRRIRKRMLREERA